VFTVNIVLGGSLLPDIRATCQCYSWRWTCSRTAHRHTLLGTLTYLRRENVTFIEPDMWPPNSPDLIDSSWLRCFGCPSADGLSTLTIHDNQPVKAGDRHWVVQTVAAFHWSRHWSVASPAWVRRPAARRTHWTFDVKTAWCDSYFNWDNKHVVSCCYFLKICCANFFGPPCIETWVWNYFIGDRPNACIIITVTVTVLTSEWLSCTDSERTAGHILKNFLGKS